MMRKLVGYIYLIREREMVDKNMEVYKVGMTTQEPNLTIQRLKSYKKESELVHLMEVNDPDITRAVEQGIVNIFKDTFIPHPDGNEYFEGDRARMISIICEVVIDANQRQPEPIQPPLNIEIKPPLNTDIKPPTTNQPISNYLPIDLSLKKSRHSCSEVHRCPRCKRTFDRKDSLNKHIRKMKPCEELVNVFVSQNQLDEIRDESARERSLLKDEIAELRARLTAVEGLLNAANRETA